MSRDDDAVADDSAAGDAVKVGRRSLGEKTEEPGPPEPEPADEGGGGGGAMIEPVAGAEEGLEVADPVAASSSSAEALPFGGLLNQLPVAVIACRTAWRPLSNTPLAPVAGPPDRPSPSCDSATPLPAASESADEVAEGAGLFFLPISSAGNGTRLPVSPAAPL